MSKTTLDPIFEKTVLLAEKIQDKTTLRKLNYFSKKMIVLLAYPKSKLFLIRLLDTSFRSKNNTKTALVLKRLFDEKTQLSLFSKLEKNLIHLYTLIGYKIPFISIPLFKFQLKKTTNSVLFFENTSQFKKHQEKRKEQEIVINTNLIGEALLGENEAEERLEIYLHLLQQPNVAYMSIKISSLYSQISPLAFKETVKVVSKRLAILFKETLKIEEKTGEKKFINLDMEAYRDLHLTVAAFKETLNAPEFQKVHAGIVLQAYLPDSHKILVKLQKWAKKRVENGGSSIKIRLVKGANLEMEKTESSFENWPLTTFSNKTETDANYKKMLLQLMNQNWAPFVNVGIASHNIHDISFALELAKKEGVKNHIQFEMLEGFADGLIPIIQKEKLAIVLYTPLVKEENYNNAIAYLVRRLDEITQDGNFLKEAFQLKTNTKKWTQIKNQFLTSVSEIKNVSEKPNRTQDRNLQQHIVNPKFENSQNTDWSLLANRKWIKEVRQKWKKPTEVLGTLIPVIGENLPSEKREKIQLSAWNGKHPWKYEMATYEDYKSVVKSSSIWYEITAAEKTNLLRFAAIEIEKKRGDLIGVAVTELGKTIAEIDVEISEAIDFANYYAESIIHLSKKDKIESKSNGINLVLSPWNFPIAIGIGGVFASLAAGKRVIFKPSTNAAATGYLVSKCLWEAGIPKSAFAFLPADEITLDPFLTNPTIFDAVILTGETTTAKYLLDRTPELNLFAETGGKNATIVTALSDREQAIFNVANSAFGNAGQKCSATSLLLLEKEIFEDPDFKKLLKDCVASKHHGNPWEFKTQIGPLALPISSKLKKSIETTPDEQWLLKPVIKNDFMLSPGIKWGITPEDFEFKKELFGPILSVMKIENLKEGVAIVNSNKYGLTSGLESLDAEEINYWLQNIEAGNLYVNRQTTGAIVQRQPFGGIKNSCFGFGMKAGGKNYVLQFLNKVEQPKTLAEIEKEYAFQYVTNFKNPIDDAKIRGQHNLNRYVKAFEILVCIDNFVDEEAIEKVRIAANVLEIPISFFTVEKNSLITEAICLKNWRDLSSKINNKTVVRVLNFNRIGLDFMRFCHNAAIAIHAEEPSNFGRYELLNYLTEQNQSINYHRYGNTMGEMD